MPPSAALWILCAASLAPLALRASPTRQDPAAIERAVRAGDRDALETLLGGPADLQSALVLACYFAAPETVHWLVERGARLDVAGDDFGTTALMAAASGNRVDLGRFLIERGAGLDVLDSLGDPALNWAAYMGTRAFVQLLLEHGADASIASVHGDALGIALRRGFEGIVDDLVAAGAAEFEVGEAAAAAAVFGELRAGKLEALESYLALGQDPQAVDAAGSPLICAAADAGPLEAVGLLLEAGAPVDARDRIGFTPLIVAAREGRRDVVLLLLAEGAEAGAVAGPLGMGMNALTMAGEGGRLEILELLIEAGAPLDTRNTMGYTALLWTLSAGQARAAEVLLEHGADPSLGDGQGTTPASMARAVGLEALALRIEALASKRS